MKTNAMTSEEFRAALGELGLPLAKAGSELGVTPPTVYRWAQGTRPVPASIAKAIENRLILRAGGRKSPSAMAALTLMEELYEARTTCRLALKSVESAIASVEALARSPQGVISTEQPGERP